eukprot:5167062-Amphidinium_carterae.1
MGMCKLARCSCVASTPPLTITPSSRSFALKLPSSASRALSLGHCSSVDNQGRLVSDGSCRFTIRAAAAEKR